MLDKKKAFTLVEMLIVIVIIGILAAAIIPKLLGLQSRARDVARKVGLGQISTALTTHRLDNGIYPNGCGSLSSIADQLKTSGLTSIPKDPKPTQNISAFETINNGQYGYCNIGYPSVGDRGAYALLAKVENKSAANLARQKDEHGIFSGGTTNFNTLLNSICDGLSCGDGDEYYYIILLR